MRLSANSLELVTVFLLIIPYLLSRLSLHNLLLLEMWCGWGGWSLPATAGKDLPDSAGDFFRVSIFTISNN
jgi:hypothetical protein